MTLPARTILLALCAATTVGGAFAFGVDVRAALRHEVESTCVPINSMLFRMRQPDGVERILVRDWDDPDRLHGTMRPWVGVIRPERRMINVVTEPDFKGERTEFCFVDGVLRYMSVGTKDYEFPLGCFPVSTNAVESLWPAAELTEAEKRANDMWRNSSRLRLFSNNPNRAALVFAEIAMIALAVALFAGSRVWQTHGVIWTLISTILLLLTQSRGGFLALLGGMAALSFFRWRRGMTGRTAGLLFLAALAIGGVAVATKTSDRLTVGTVAVGDDPSSQRRLAIWKEIPRMISAAPLGWGLWKSGPAYNSWFEKPRSMHMIGDLFNDHFSRFVEGGFVLGGVYVFVWSFALIGGWQWARRRESPLPLAECLVYFVASSFNPMNWWMPGFLVPAAVFAWAGVRYRAVLLRAVRGRTFARTVLLASVVTAVMVSGAGVLAWMAPGQDVPIRVGWLGKRTVVGKGEPHIWVVDDGFVLCGDYNGFPGREIRDFYCRNPDAEALGIVSDVDDLPSAAERIVLTGRRAVDFCERADSHQVDHLILLTPRLEDDTLARLRTRSDAHVLTGEYVARLMKERLDGEDCVHVVPAAEIYIPRWLDMTVRKSQ